MQLTGWFIFHFEEIGGKSSQAGRSDKFLRVANHPAEQGKPGEDTHAAGTQAKGSSHSQGSRIASTYLHFPDMVIPGIWCAKAEIRCQGERQRVSRSQVPITHACSIRGFMQQVKGLQLGASSVDLANPGRGFIPASQDQGSPGSICRELFLSPGG
jgi:outer membrane receptor for Fe3+-dicitrate